MSKKENYTRTKADIGKTKISVLDLIKSAKSLVNEAHATIRMAQQHLKVEMDAEEQQNYPVEQINAVHDEAGKLKQKLEDIHKKLFETVC